MLTNIHRKYIEICTQKISDNKLSDKQLSKNLGLSVRTISRAVEWGKRNDIFRKDSTNRIEYHIQEVRKHLELIENEIMHCISTRKKKEQEENNNIHNGYSSTIIGLSRELRVTRILLMELEGLYNKTQTIDNQKNIVVVIDKELSQDYK